MKCPRGVPVSTLPSKARDTRKALTLMCGQWGLVLVAPALGENPVYVAELSPE